MPNYSNFEQLFSAGIDDVIEKREKFKYTINDIPKGLVKLCKERTIKISNNFLSFYKENSDAYLLAYKLEHLSLNDHDIYNILSYGSCNYDRENRCYIYYSYFNRLLNEYGYTPKPLLLYIDSLKTFEAIEDVGYIMKELYDYANMMKTISCKFEKYPRNFLTTHKIACRNYSRLKIVFKEDLFLKRVDKSLEFTYKNYKFIYPNSTQDIKDEAVQQNNCVASYISNVLDGKCHILFLRKKDDLDKSLVTIEIRDNKIIQAKGKFNREITSEEQTIIDKWNEQFNKSKKMYVSRML